MKKRIFYSDNGTLTDMTTVLNSYYSGESEITLVAAEDAIYIGSNLPFNTLFFKVGTAPNDTASTVNVSYWSRREWIDAVEVIDETSLSGATLGQDGFIYFVPNKDYVWERETTNDNNDQITGLSSVVIYDLYWLKLTFSADLTVSSTLSYVGNYFSNDDDLGTEYADLVRSSLMTAWEANKTNWEEQSIRAADIIEKDLINKKLIQGKEQILNREDLTLASVSKVAEIIYNGLGDDYLDQKLDARKEYYQRLDRAFPVIDTNRDGRESVIERESKVNYGRFSR